MELLNRRREMGTNGSQSRKWVRLGSIDARVSYYGKLSTYISCELPFYGIMIIDSTQHVITNSSSAYFTPMELDDSPRNPDTDYEWFYGNSQYTRNPKDSLKRMVFANKQTEREVQWYSDGVSPTKTKVVKFANYGEAGTVSLEDGSLCAGRFELLDFPLYLRNPGKNCDVTKFAILIDSDVNNMDFKWYK